MDKIINIPESIIYEIPQLDNELMIGSVVISLYKGNERVVGNVLLPVILFKIPFAQVLLIILIHNNKELFSYEDISKLLPLLHFKYNKDTKDLKDSHIKMIIGDNEESFIQFINDLIVNILEGYVCLPDSDIDECKKIYSLNDCDDLRFKDGISIIHSIIMRAIICSIFDKSRMNDYKEYERKLLPMSKYHLLYKEKSSIKNSKYLFGNECGISEDECCLFNELLVHHTLLNLGIALENIIREIYFNDDDSGIIDSIESIGNIFSDYPCDNSGYDRLQYTFNKLLKIYDGTEKCAYIINGEIGIFMNKLFDKPLTK